ncbi:MAG: YdcF family protein [Rhodospirillaceae bacterium]|jgi:uncharacterized SAM-binding protein YcdF (DUF218 family)|nr:YdcF family protein [Rhodospirillaceae bacterium]MBT4487390.1 YdcF family protein [Rhodospirillaceae bacterium]MBT5195322.1 YdcF family protein [Rhodospirillaceae bacterium]MBT5898363.1 YdcF family protein [Rhodospirillaceae bacterium]MBT6427426.1 YdcF family protein [Rhodospirillaceae bacterium]
MFYSIAKMFWGLATPLNLTLILLCLATIMLWSRWRRQGAWLASLVTIVLLLIAVLPLGSWVLAPLRNQFAPYDVDAGPAHGIVLLSGAVVNLGLSQKMGHVVPGRAASRMVEFMRLARAFPRARLLICGGNVDRSGGKSSRAEAVLIADYLVSRGIVADRLMIEDRSRDTYENAVMGRALARPKGGERWLLVTTAWHMPRAMAVFRAQGWPVVAAPPMAGRRQSVALRLGFNLGSGLGAIRVAMHEYIGLLAYRLNGRSTTLWPEP